MSICEFKAIKEMSNKQVHHKPDVVSAMARGFRAPEARLWNLNRPRMLARPYRTDSETCGQTPRAGV